MFASVQEGQDKKFLMTKILKTASNNNNHKRAPKIKNSKSKNDHQGAVTEPDDSDADLEKDVTELLNETQW